MPREIITLPSLPNGEESGISLEIIKKKRNPYTYRKKEIISNDVTYESIGVIANQIVNNNLSEHQKKKNDYDGSGKINLKTLGEVIHSNHSDEVHNSIMNNSQEIYDVKLFYGDNKVRIESNGDVMAIALYCRNVPKNLSVLQGWECIYNKNKIVLYTENNNLINEEVELFNYTSSLRIYKAEVIGANKEIIRPSINLEGLDYWRLLEGNWETMDSVHWENYKGVY